MSNSPEIEIDLEALYRAYADEHHEDELEPAEHALFRTAYLEGLIAGMRIVRDRILPARELDQPADLRTCLIQAVAAEVRTRIQAHHLLAQDLDTIETYFESFDPLLARTRDQASDN